MIQTWNQYWDRESKMENVLYQNKTGFNNSPFKGQPELSEWTKHELPFKNLKVRIPFWKFKVQNCTKPMRKSKLPIANLKVKLVLNKNCMNNSAWQGGKQYYLPFTFSISIII